MSGFITAKIASAASNIETTGKALSFGAAVGTSGGKLLGWINANGVALGLLVALLSWWTTAAISIWYKRRKLRILERTGIDTDGDDE